MEVRRRVIKVDYEPRLLESVFAAIDNDRDWYFQWPPVNVYYHIYQMITGDDPSRYHAALEAVNRFAGFFPKGELQNLYNYLQNYCVNQINKSRPEFLRASFELYQIQLEKALLVVDGELPEWHYKNIVAAGLRLSETGWVRHFLEEYRPLLHPDVQENAYSYNLAEYYYTTGAYKKALRLLLQVSYTNPRYSLSAKALLLRTYYDLREHEALLALCKAFRQQLRRSKSISEFRRKGYQNLFSLTRKASQVRYNIAFTSPAKTAQAFKNLNEKMQQLAPIFNQEWLQKRVEAIGEEMEA